MANATKVFAILLLVAVLFISGCVQSKPAGTNTQAVAAPSLDSESDAISSELEDLGASSVDLSPGDLEIEVIVE